MHDGHEYSLDSAKEAAARDDLGSWVSRFLSSPGSDNAPLAEQLSEPPRRWLGPVRLPIDRLHRLAGPPDHPVLCPVNSDYWRDDVEEMAQDAKDGWEPPPVVVTYRRGQLVLEDGNHRVESLRRVGKSQIWAVISFEDADEADHFAAS